MLEHSECSVVFVTKEVAVRFFKTCVSLSQPSTYTKEGKILHYIR